MHTVSTELKKRVTAQVKESIKKSGVNLPMPTILYNINSARLGGSARISTNTIRLNPVFLNAHTDAFIKQTVQHEVCHLITFKKYGAFIDAHGEQWKREMRNLGIPPDRCHQYTVPAGVKAGKQTRKFDIVCTKCGTIMQTGMRSYNNMLAGRSSYKHSKCGGNIIVGRSPNQVLAVRPAPQAVTPKAPAGTQSKLAKCFAMYKTYKHTYDRATMIRTFIQEAGCTTAGAATYFATCKNLDK